MKNYQAWAKTNENSTEECTVVVSASNKKEALIKLQEIDKDVKLKDVYLSPFKH